MSTKANMGSCNESNFRTSTSQHAISFRSGAINTSSTNMIPMANYYGVENNNTSMVYPGNLNIMSNSLIIPQPGSSLLVESVPGLMKETGFVVEWSTEEQFKLEEGLKKYEDESSFMKYVKIAATLDDKSVRDVALRCSWMMRKRRKQDERNLLKNVKERKDKLVESSSKTNISLASPLNLAPYSLFMNRLDHSERVPIEALGGPTRQLLERNNQVLNQIEANLSILKLRENIDLFLRTRNNLAVVLNEYVHVTSKTFNIFLMSLSDFPSRKLFVVDMVNSYLCSMRRMSGIMSKMPPLPVTINEGLINNLLPNKSQVMLLGSSSGIYLKQEPG